VVGDRGSSFSGEAGPEGAATAATVSGATAANGGAPACQEAELQRCDSRASSAGSNALRLHCVTFNMASRSPPQPLPRELLALNAGQGDSPPDLIAIATQASAKGCWAPAEQPAAPKAHFALALKLEVRA
jgi:hypothetical protein